MIFTSNLRDHVEEPVGLHLHADVYQLAEVEGDEAGLLVVVDIPGEVHSGDLHLGAGPGTHQVAGVPAHHHHHHHHHHHPGHRHGVPILVVHLSRSGTHVRPADRSPRDVCPVQRNNIPFWKVTFPNNPLNNIEY